MSDLRELLARAQAATGADRELDIDLMVRFLPRHRKEQAIGIDSLVWFVMAFQDGRWQDVQPISYTASLDAVTALIEQVLPGVFWIMSKGRARRDEPLYAAEMLFGTDEILGEAEADSAPLALLAALLSAKINMETRDAA
jgi:hypothetical protein